MTGRPLGQIAVIVPAHNAEATIGTTLASVAAQTVPPSVVVVVDDGSTDRTSDEAGSWAHVLPLQVVRTETPCGPARARDLGIRQTTTTGLALLDADDVWLPDHLSTLASLWHGEDDLVGAQAIRWLPGQGLADRPWPVRVPGRSQIEKLVRRNLLFVGCLFHRSLYDRVGGFRDGGAEDWDLWIRMVRAGAHIVLAGHPTALYRLSESSLSADDRALQSELQAARRVLEEARGHAERRAVRAAIRELEGRAALVRAYALAREGRPGASRRAALGALRGPPRVALRGATVLVAPRAGARIRDARHWRPARWLRL